jgi:acyl-CoA synthetase (NDP forming)
LIGVSTDVTKTSSLAWRNLRQGGYGGEVHRVHPRGEPIDGQSAVERVTDLPEDIDIALCAVPSAAAVDVVRGLGERGTRVAVVVSSGYSEAGAAGSVLERKLRQAADSTGIRIIGPNCNGLFSAAARFSLGINRAHGEAHPTGGISIISQSGALIGAVVQLCTESGAGLRSFVSTGNEVDLTLTDVLEMVVADEGTGVIALIMDRVGDGRRFSELCRRAHDAGKYVLAFKFGNSGPGRDASQSHSAHLAGDSRVYDALFERAHVIRCETLPELAATAAVLDSHGVPKSPGVLVSSMSGAGGAFMVDALDEHAVPLMAFGPDLVGRLRESFRFVQPANPVDLSGIGGLPNVGRAFEILKPEVRGRMSVLLYTPPPTKQAGQGYADAMTELVASDRRDGGCAIAVVMDRSDPEVTAKWLAAGIPVLQSPADAAAVAANVLRAAGGDRKRPTHSDGGRSAGGARSDGLVVGESETTEFLARFGVPFARHAVVRTEADAGRAADEIGYPVVVKGLVPGLAHKAEHGLVALGVRSAPEAVRASAALFESMRKLAPDQGDSCRVAIAEQVPDGLDLLVSVRRDPEVGGVVLLGLGGTNAERIASTALLLTPIEGEDVREAMRTTGAITQLELAGSSLDDAVDSVSALVDRLLRAISESGASFETIELNPVRLVPGRAGAVALDALGVLSGSAGRW